MTLFTIGVLEYLMKVYSLNKKNHAKLYPPSTFQTSDIKLLSQKKRNMHPTNSPKRDNIYILGLNTR